MKKLFNIIAVSFISVCQVFFGVPCAYAQQSKTDSLKAELKNDLHDTTRVNIFLSLADRYSYENPDSAIWFATQAKTLAEKINDRGCIANSLRELGWDYYVKGDYPQALKYYFQALEINEQLLNSSSPDGRDREGAKKGIAATLGNIGLVYRNQGDYPAALKHYFQALEIDKELGNKSGMAIRLGNIGNVYKNQGDYPAALKHYFEALEIDKELGSKSGMAFRLGYIGIVYYNQGDYPAALKHYFQALEIDKELGNKSNIAAWLGNIGSLYTKTGKFNEAEAYLDSALSISDSIGTLNITMHVDELFTHLHDTLAQSAFSKKQFEEAAKRYRLAYQHHQQYGTAKDTLFNEEKSKEIGRLEQKHEFEMVEMERRQEEEERQRQEQASLSRRNLLQYSGILIAIALLFLAIVVTPTLGGVSKRIPPRLMEAAVFITFLVFFEFILVLTDPYIDNQTGGAPAWKLLINAGFAAVIFPLHAFFEGKLKKRMLKMRKKVSN